MKKYLTLLLAITFSLYPLTSLRAEDKLPPPKPLKAKVEFTEIGEVEFAAPENNIQIRYTLDGSAPSAKSYVYCVPVRAASTLKLKAACFDAEGKSSDPVEVEFVRTPAEKSDRPAKLTVAINLDFSAAPELKDWALQARKLCEEYYPVIMEKMPIEGYTPPRQVMMTWKDMPGVAYTTGTKITFAINFYKKNPKDFGSAIHEFVHIYQQYKGKVPGWVTEGIADWIRWQNWEPVEVRRKFNPKSAKLANAYNDAAVFLVYLEKTYDKDLIKKINDAAHKGTYSDDLIKMVTNKEVPALWDEFIASFDKPVAPASDAKPAETKTVAEKP